VATPHAERQQDNWKPSPLALQRMAFRRRRTIRSAVAAAVSTVVVVLGAGLLLVNAPGWPRLRSTFFDVAYGWEVLPEIAPELTEWSALFASGAERRARAEAGIRGAATCRDADDLLRAAAMFLRLVERMLVLQPALPRQTPPADGEPGR